MSVSAGVDIVHIPTFKKAMCETPRLKQRVFSETELKNNVHSLAGRFAAKEAFIKSIKGKLRIELRDIVINIQNQAPIFKIDLIKYPHLANFDFELSISHQCDYAIAFVLSSSKFSM